MGANHQKEIAFLCDIAQPDYGYITNFGKAHLEGFGGVEGVIKGKSEMYDYLTTHHKKVFVNLDDPIQVQKTQLMPTITFGIQHPEAVTSIDRVSANPFVEIEYFGTLIQSHLIGLYNANNINAAITIGRYFGVEDIDIKKAIENYIPENNRSQLVRRNSNEIILDAYNANPSSMAVAITNFSQLDQKDKVAILGDMFELGSESLTEHRAVVHLLEGQPAIECYFIGKDFYQCKTDVAHFHFYETFESFAVALEKLDWRDKVILIKGSRGMALERALEFL